MSAIKYIYPVKDIILALVFFHVCLSAFSNQDTPPVTIKGADFKKNETYYMYGKFHELLTNNPDTWNTKYTILENSKRSRIKLKIDRSKVAGKNFGVKIKFIYVNLHWDSSLASFRPGKISYGDSLEVSYSHGNPYKDIDISEYTGTGCYYIVISEIIPTVTNANWQDATSLILESDFVWNNKFNTNSRPIVTGTTINNNELQLKWIAPQGAEEYDLEWAWVSNRGLTGESSGTDKEVANKVFENDATRITTDEPSYKIPILYSSGYILYRVRAIGLDPSGSGGYVRGQWTFNQNSSDDNVSDFPRVNIATGHEENLNWQQQVNYAEKGKKKAVVSYYDGTSRSRQTVSHINSENTAVVAETIYDLEGRQAVTVLPAPADGGTIQYYDKFNKNISGKPYSWKNFDGTPGECTITTDPMSTVSGASKYYNSDDSKTGFDKFVPDAKGYPFSQVEYTPDNTGRISKQSGIGPDHLLYSGRETKYYYSTPLQKELDRLFGNEAGDFKHHKKTVTIDANGQATVTIQDMSGTTVATALSGPEPDNLKRVGDYNTITETDKLLSGQEWTDIVKTRSENTFNTVLTEDKHYDFTYEVNYPKAYTIECLTNDAEWAFDIIFDIHFEITNSCGVKQNIKLTTSGATASQNIDLQFGGASDDASNIMNAIKNGTYTHITPDNNTDKKTISFETDGTLIAGEYTIKKVITINEEALNYYENYYLYGDNTDCKLDLGDFMKEEEEKAETEGCDACDVCLNNLGENLVEFNQFRSDNDLTPLSGDEYQQLIIDCDKYCSAKNDNCNDALSLMLKDISPRGQYALVDMNSDNEYVADNYLLSIFNESNILSRKPTGNIKVWKDPKHYKTGLAKFYDYDGNEDKVSVVYFAQEDKFNIGIDWDASVKSKPTEDGVYEIPPQWISNLTDFLTYWKDSWAESFVTYHPEYQFYIQCIGEQKASNDFDKAWLALEEPEDIGTADPWNTLENITDYDPFWSTANLSTQDATLKNSLKSKFESRLEYYSVRWEIGKRGITLHKKSMWETAYTARHCPSNFKAEDESPCQCNTDYFPTTFNGFIECKSGDCSVWELYRQMYYSLKQDFVNLYYKDYKAIKGDYFNACIGHDDFKYSKEHKTMLAEVAKGECVNVYPEVEYNPFKYSKSTWFFNYGCFDYSQYFGWHRYKPYQMCNISNYEAYKEKSARFPYPAKTTDNSGYDESICESSLIEGQESDCFNTLEETIERANRKKQINHFEICRECPVTYDMSKLFTGIAETSSQGIKRSGQIPLSCYPIAGISAFGPEMETAFGFNNDKTAAYYWTLESEDSEELVATVSRGTQNCEFTLKKQTHYKLPTPSGETLVQIDWDMITTFCCVNYLENEEDAEILEGTEITDNEGTRFALHADVEYSAGGKTYLERIKLEGYQSCFTLNDCKILDCEASDAGRAYFKLFRRMHQDFIGNEGKSYSNRFYSSSLIIDSHTNNRDLDSLIGPSIETAIKADGNSVYSNLSSLHHWEFTYSKNGNEVTVSLIARNSSGSSLGSGSFTFTRSGNADFEEMIDLAFIKENDDLFQKNVSGFNLNQVQTSAFINTLFKGEDFTEDIKCSSNVLLNNCDVIGYGLE